ncbi:hypothetical protein SDC9_84972 [bioreactor metagenome]|uniref:Uncharacterized protein n=1 Tax=bioreactor metagenome TaxID=1076179 RepID=A0A644ZI16_9ZZZZ
MEAGSDRAEVLGVEVQHPLGRRGELLGALQQLGVVVRGRVGGPDGQHRGGRVVPVVADQGDDRLGQRQGRRNCPHRRVTRPRAE